MDKKKMHQSICEIRFGVSGLHNPSLIKNFYPADLPEDWRLGYYSNEFHLILVKLSELDAHLSAVEDDMTVLSDVLTELGEEIAGEDVTLLVEISEWPATLEKALLKFKLAHRNIGEENLHFINLKKMMPEKITPSPLTLQWGKTLNSDSAVTRNRDSGNADGHLICYVADKQAIEPVQLKKLIELVRERAMTECVKTVDVIFSSTQNALDNCRNATLLETLM